MQFVGALLLLMTTIPASHAQKQTPLDVALRYIEQNREKWQLNEADLAEMIVNDQYQTRHNGVTHIYFMQSHQGIRVHNAILGVHVKADGKVAFATSRFVPNLAGKVNAAAPLLSAEQAIVKASQHLQLPGKASPRFVSKTEKGEAIFEDKAISRSPIKVQLMYQLMPNGSLRIAWDLAIQELETPDYWSVRIDALNGDLLDKNNWTIYCSFPKGSSHRHSDACLPEKKANNFAAVREAAQNPNLFTVDGARYNVFPLPIESPLHGVRQLVINPADQLASPFGWHDTNGQPGAEYTITRGNNVHAFADRQGSNISNQDEPDGGAMLTFDFPFNEVSEPDTYTHAATTQLFYLNNFMHDFAYHYGFDEQAGNFQQNNYGNGGNEGDFVLAQAQDGGGNNNANFSTPPDGANGSMQMYLWGVNGDNLLSVTSPEVIARSYETASAGFGPAITDVPIIGQVVEARDNSNDPKKACGTIVNAGDVAGKIAMIDRGGCFFEEKVVNAEKAGAIAVIICNFENNVISMGGVGTITDPDIPTVMMTSADCQLIRQYLEEGVTVKFQLSETTGPSRLDGSFDNGIVAHEYGHGISTRLTGGPTISSCLSNDEQMGEGWSDFFALVATAQPEDAPKARGIGSYVWNRDPNGKGFRRLPYSTDLNVNPQTYDDIIGAAVPHGVGEVWAGVLWDLFWKLVEMYGWDDDIKNGSGGNNLAIQLVMDGMKLQSCSPGYLDGRDAILAADLINNDGANQCLIWEVFARRGLGWSAEQNNSFNAYDGRAAFDVMPECLKELKIAKSATPLIEAGEEITYRITVINHKDEPVSGVVVTDNLPESTDYIAGSATGNAEVSTTNGFIQFEIGDLAPGEERIITYKVSTSSANRSYRLYFDDMESGFANWINDAFEGADIWDVTEQLPYKGEKSLFVPNTARENDQIAQLAEPFLVTGNQPVLRFYHNYDTDPGLDGGIVQISTDGGASWETAEAQLFRNSYYGRIAYNTFATANLRAFTGSSRGFVGSYFDLSAYQGKKILVRFRFGSLAEPANQPETATGWAVDNFEFMDLYNYQSEACVTSDQGDQACATAPEGGTIVESSVLTNADELEKKGIQIKLYPNPANNIVNLAITAPEAGEATMSIFRADGSLLQRRQIGVYKNEQILPFDISALPGGFYLVEIRSGQSVVTEKMIIQ